jgi:hypothetical protein
MTHKFNRPGIAKGFITPTNDELLDHLDAIRLWAEEVCDELKETPSGDAIEYRGSMNNVELLREAIDHYNGLFYRVKP